MKSKHYTMSWDVFKAVEIVEAYEAKTGDTSGRIPYQWLRKIYTGNHLMLYNLAKLRTYSVTV